jgi:hypothetical protein
MLSRLLHVTLLCALGLVLSGAPRLWLEAGCADDCAEDARVADGPGLSCAGAADGTPESCGGLACCPCACGTPARVLLASGPARLVGPSGEAVGPLTGPPGLARPGIAAEVFLPPRLG